MKVTVQRTVELAEIPFYANNMIEEATEQLDTLADLSKALDVTKLDDFVKNLDFLRQKMFQIDTKFEECAKLMDAYMQTLRQPPESEAENAAPPPPNRMNDINEMMKNMPQSVDGLKDFYNNILEQNKLHSDEPFPTFPDLDLASLQEKKDKIEGILNDE